MTSTSVRMIASRSPMRSRPGAGQGDRKANREIIPELVSRDCQEQAAGYEPWFAHNRAHGRRRRHKRRIFERDGELRRIVGEKLGKRWSPAQISKWLRHRFRKHCGWHVRTETIYEATYRGLIIPTKPENLRTERTNGRRRGRGRSREGALKQCTAMKSIHERPAIVEARRQPLDNSVEVPNARNSALLGPGGPLTDHHTRGDVAARALPGPAAWHPQCASGAQAGHQFSLERAAALT
jgi:hypothetical protein